MDYMHQLLAEEFRLRGCACPAEVTFRTDAALQKDRYIIAHEGSRVEITAQGKRGHIFGLGRLLRKTQITGGKAELVCNLSGDYAPRMPIRGHQIGYRGNNNTYDAWQPEQFKRYQLEMMLFGSNIAEHVPDEGGNTSPLMPIPPNEMLRHVSAYAQELDMDFGLWYPIDHRQPEAEAYNERERLFAELPRLDYVFIPGSDPGELPPDQLFARGAVYTRLLRQAHPEAKMWISAQMPHNAPEWPAQFVAELEKEPDWLEGVIMGPNHAFSPESLRRVTPSRYDTRLYPDFTHSLRCEYPVHYHLQDWHYSLAATMSRESVDPRPREFQMLHRQTRGYISGSVSYSEGVHDDVNKMLWTDMDWFGDGISLRESLEDYARLFLWGVPAGTAADGILMLEQNWDGDPADNAGIGHCLHLWETLVRDCPQMHGNWRFNLLLFRAKCDAYVRQKRLAELNAIARRDWDYTHPAHDLFPLAQVLFDQIGIQLDVAHFGGLRWERGCTLDTIDRPITDLPWLKQQHARGLLEQSLRRNNIAPDEFYFSFAHHDRGTLNCEQEGEFYLDFQGDRPENNGCFPTCLFQVFDHFTFKCRLGGFTPRQDYVLRVTWLRRGCQDSQAFCITANGREIYRGQPYGGTPDPEFDAAMLGHEFHTRSYPLPASVFENGCLVLEMSEPLRGIMLSEFWVLKA